MSDRIRFPLAALSALSLAAAVGGCSSSKGTAASTHAAAASLPPGTRIALDGDVAEWPADTVILADSDWIYVRFSLGADGPTLQASSESTILAIDLDGSKETGVQRPKPAAAADLGIDVEIHCSPRADDGQPGRGVAVYVFDASGNRRQVSHADIDFSFSPTYAAEWYELRISRHLDGLPGLGPIDLAVPSRTGTIVLLYDASGTLAGWSDPAWTRAPARAAALALSDQTIPPCPQGAIRVMSWNVLKGAPMSNSGPFARLIQVAEPDVILLQEWTVDDPTQIAGWFAALVPTGPGEMWQVVTSEAWGVAIASRHPMEPLGPSTLTVSGSAADDPIRFVGALVRTPVGPVAAASTHLKCCGTKGSAEDHQRQDEARAINAAMLDATATGPEIRVIGGDMNLVGSRPPLDLLLAGLDADGSDLAIADAPVLGDAAWYTWTEAPNQFSPGRLDYVLVSDASARIVNAFVVDTARLSDASLASMGIDRTDSRASDHLPIIVDIEPR